MGDDLTHWEPADVRRELLGKTQEALGEMYGVSPRTPSGDPAEAIVDALYGALTDGQRSLVSKDRRERIELQTRIDEYERRWETEWGALKNQWDKIRTRLAEIESVHAVAPDGNCPACHVEAPCQTMQILLREDED